jgi:hypothetical protein
MMMVVVKADYVLGTVGDCFGETFLCQEMTQLSLSLGVFPIED